MEERELYEEYKLLPQPLAWVLLVLFSAAVIGFGLWVHALVPNVPRQWDFGGVPEAPAESVYTTQSPDMTAKPPLMIQPLPWAEPLDEPTAGEPAVGEQGGGQTPPEMRP